MTRFDSFGRLFGFGQPTKAFRPVRAILNAELNESNVPGEDASWNEWSGIPSCASSFNGVEYFCLYRVLDHEGGNLEVSDLPRAEAILFEIRNRVRRRLFA